MDPPLAAVASENPFWRKECAADNHFQLPHLTEFVRIFYLLALAWVADFRAGDKIPHGLTERIAFKAI